MKLLILSDLHVEFETFEVAKDLDYDVAVLAGHIMAPGRAAASWLGDPARFGDKPIMLIAGNHEYYGVTVDQEQVDMRRQADEHGNHFLDCDEVVIAGVRFLGCTLWTDYRLRIDNPGFAGQPVCLLFLSARGICNPRGYLTGHGEFESKDFNPALIVNL